MPTYDKPTKKMHAALDKVRGWPVHNERLAVVQIGLLAVHAARDEDNEPRGEALREDNDVCYAKIKIRNLEERAADKQRGLLVEDARILLNGDRWGTISAEMQRAEIDRCLTTICVKMKDDKPVLDDVGRPKLTKRKPDKVIRIFHEVVERNGASAVAANDVRVLFNDSNRQLYLPLLSPGDDLPAVTVARPKRKSIPAVTGYAIGDMGAQPLANVIERLERPETVLAIARLAWVKKPKPPVKAALTKRARDLKVKTELAIVKNGDPSSYDLDYAAAVLISTAAPDDETLARLVPECEDAQVLGFLHSDELEDDGGRTKIVDLLANRMDNLKTAMASAVADESASSPIVH